LDRVLTDFGCEHSFARAVESVREHYGFEMEASAVRTATLEHAQRARVKLEEDYQQPFRVLPAVGAEHVIGETDGTMICTVQPGPQGQASARMEGNEVGGGASQGQRDHDLCGHRHVLQARLKKAGTAWLPEHADQIAHLRVLRADHQWASLWN
jgi:hypothetical protein